MEQMQGSNALVDKNINTCLDPAEAPTIIRSVGFVPLDIRVYNQHVWYADEVALRVHFEKKGSCPNKVDILFLLNTSVFDLKVSSHRCDVKHGNK